MGGLTYQSRPTLIKFPYLNQIQRQFEGRTGTGRFERRAQFRLFAIKIHVDRATAQGKRIRTQDSSRTTQHQSSDANVEL